MPPSASHPACTGDRHLRRYVDVDTMHAHGHAYTHTCTRASARIIRMVQAECEAGSVGRKARAVVADFVNDVFLQRGVAGRLLQERADSSGIPHVRDAPAVDRGDAWGGLQAQVEPPLCVC